MCAVEFDPQLSTDSTVAGKDFYGGRSGGRWGHFGAQSRKGGPGEGSHKTLQAREEKNLQMVLRVGADSSLLSLMTTIH